MITHTLRRLWPDIAFVLKWSIATLGGFMFGFICGGPLFGMLVGRIDAKPTDSTLLIAAMIALSLSGLGLGTLQWLVLQQRIRIDWWIPASVLGAILTGLLMQIFGSLSVFGDSVQLYGMFIGATLGAIQWLALRRKVRQAGAWIVITALAWVAGNAALNAPDGALSFGLFDLRAVIVYSLVGGVVMARLLRQPVAQRPTALSDEQHPSA